MKIFTIKVQKEIKKKTFLAKIFNNYTEPAI